MLLAGEQQHQIRASLERLLASRTFRRSDQLKKLISYLCEAELLGRRDDLDEYRIAVEALGRPAAFSPEQDSSVRTRTHALRQKLVEYYASEGVGDHIQIEVPKGSYIPVFREQREHPVVAVAGPPPQLSRLPYWLLGVGAVCVILIAVAISNRWLVAGPAWTSPSLIREFWRPMIESERAVAICVGQPVHLWVRAYGDSRPPTLQYSPIPDPVPNSEQFRTFYRSRVNQDPPSGLVLHPSPNSPLWGDSAGASAAIRFLTQQGVATDLLPESTLRNSYPLKDRNALIFGRAEFSQVVREMTPSGGFHSTYLSDEGRHAIVHEKDPSRRFLNSMQVDEVNFGLITVLRPTSGKGPMQVTFSGITSDGALAGMDFLSSAEGLARARRELGGAWPSRFQIVVKTRSINGYPLKTEYAAHHVF